MRRVLVLDATRREIVVRPDRDALARAGVTIAALEDAAAASRIGLDAGVLVEGERRTAVRVRIGMASPGDERSEPPPGVEALRAISLPTAAGGQVPLGDVASISVEESQEVVHRADGRRFTEIVVELADPAARAAFELGLEAPFVVAP